MINRGIASMFVVGALALTACANSPAGSRATATQKPTTAVAAPADATAAAPADATAAAPADATAEVPAEGATVEVTPTEELTPTGDVVPTEEVTPTVEVTPTEGTTGTPEDGDFVVDETDVKTVLARVTVNVRSGPGLQYEVISRLRARRTATVTGASPDARWYRVECADETEVNCWVTADQRYVTARK